MPGNLQEFCKVRPSVTSNLTLDLVIWNKLFRIRCRCLPVAIRKPAVETVAATAAALDVAFELFELLVPLEAFERLEVDASALEVAFELFELLVPFEAFEPLEVDTLEVAFTADQVELTIELSVEVLRRRVHKPDTDNAAVMFRRLEKASDEFVTFDTPETNENAAVMFKPIETASDEFVTFEAPVDCSNRRLTTDLSPSPTVISNPPRPRPCPRPCPLTAWRESRLRTRLASLRLPTPTCPRHMQSPPTAQHALALGSFEQLGRRS